MKIDVASRYAARFLLCYFFGTFLTRFQAASSAPWASCGDRVNHARHAKPRAAFSTTAREPRRRFLLSSPTPSLLIRWCIPVTVPSFQQRDKGFLARSGRSIRDRDSRSQGHRCKRRRVNLSVSFRKAARLLLFYFLGTFLTRFPAASSPIRASCRDHAMRTPRNEGTSSPMTAR